MAGFRLTSLVYLLQAIFGAGNTVTLNVMGEMVEFTEGRDGKVGDNLFCGLCIGIVGPLLTTGGQACPDVCKQAMDATGLGFILDNFCKPICDAAGQITCNQHMAQDDCARNVCAFAQLCKDGPAVPEVEFSHFVNKFDKQYQDENERNARYLNFKTNVAEIAEKNLKEGSGTYQVGPLADLSAAEFQTYYLGLKMPSEGHVRNSSSYLGEFVPPANMVVKDSVDWVSLGAVTPVKNQEQCGSCWTFSTTGAIEGAWQVATGTLLSLSEQQIVDCSKSGGFGCQGGWPFKAIEWESQQAICGESGYPYTAKDGACHTCSNPVLAVGSVIGSQSVSQTSAALMAALNTKPVSVCVDANNWQHAGSGIFSSCGTSLDHAVLAVGYDSSSWKVKNSWGAWWADHGYIHLKMGNTCGVLNAAVLAVVSGSEEAVKVVV